MSEVELDAVGTEPVEARRELSLDSLRRDLVPVAAVPTFADADFDRDLTISSTRIDHA